MNVLEEYSGERFAPESEAPQVSYKTLFNLCTNIYLTNSSDSNYKAWAIRVCIQAFLAVGHLLLGLMLWSYFKTVFGREIQWVCIITAVIYYTTISKTNISRIDANCLGSGRFGESVGGSEEVEHWKFIPKLLSTVRPVPPMSCSSLQLVWKVMLMLQSLSISA